MDTLTLPLPRSRSISASVQRSRRRADTRALLLVLPLVLFLAVTFVVPIARLLWTGAYDPTIANLMPATSAKLAEWNGSGLPDAAAFAAAAEDLKAAAEQQTIGQIGSRLNYETSGLRSTVSRTARALRAAGPGSNPASILRDADKAWSDRETWVTIQRLGRPVTPVHYMAALDLRFDIDGKIERVPEDERIYVKLFLRTMAIAGIVTISCLLLAYPLAYLLATAPPRWRNILMICVLLPLWTSLLVRTASWIVLLQTNGVLNNLLVALGLIDDAGRLQMVFNRMGTLIAMTHILLPFMVLPIYSVMTTIPGNLMRAAQSLGANRYLAFWKVYAPLSSPGVGAGVAIVFILSIGYYITPALLGGSDGVLISNLIAYHMQRSLNWSLAAALSGILLIGVLALYWVYGRLTDGGKLALGR